MDKILLIIKREYLTRVKKKSFIIMTILGPLLMAGVMIVPIWLAMNSTETHRVEVIDETGLFKELPNNKNTFFDFPPVSIDQAKKNLYDTDYSAILYIPENVVSGGNTVQIFYQKQLGIGNEQYIGGSIEKIIYNEKLIANNIDIDVIKNAETKINVVTEKQEKSGTSQRTNTSIYMAIGLFGGVLIYIFIFLYGAQVMRGVMEEKTNRIVEVILSSVKPFQLMMGKIIGVALVGLTQFVLWLVLTLGIYSVMQATILKNVNEKVAQQVLAQEEVLKKGADLKTLDLAQKNRPDKVFSLFKDLESVNFKEIIICFLFYFLGGYLLYSALFAAIGAAVDNEADTQQFMIPITVPLVLSFLVAQTIIQNPESQMAFWFSIIPFTSPIVMMVRLPFGVPLHEILLSMTLLVVGFVGTVWLAGKIYRTGILMYGKKVTYQELWKWLFYKG